MRRLERHTGGRIGWPSRCAILLSNGSPFSRSRLLPRLCCWRKLPSSARTKLGEDAAGACAGWCLPFRVRNDGDHRRGIADMDASKMPMLACVSCCCCCFLLVLAIALGPSPAMLAWGWKLERAQPACTSNARAAGQLQRVPAAAAAAQRLISLYTRLCMRRHTCCCHLDAEVAGLTRFSSRFIQLLARRCARIAASQGVQRCMLIRTSLLGRMHLQIRVARSQRSYNIAERGVKTGDWSDDPSKPTRLPLVGEDPWCRRGWHGSAWPGEPLG